MNSTPQNKDERINLRLKPNAKQLLERAASFEGQSVSKFVLTCALNQAEKTIQEHEAMSLGVRESEAFYTALAKPVRFNTKLIEALKDHDDRVRRN